MTEQEMQNRLLMLMMTGAISPQAPQEYSSTKGWQPFDLGSMSTYTNVVDNWATPEMSALLRATMGLDSGDAPASNQGRLTLQAVADGLGETSMEGIIANQLLNGYSPSEAVANAEEYMTTKGGLQFGDTGERDAWRKAATDKADTWFSDMIAGDVENSQPSETDAMFGLPAVGTEFDLLDLNPMMRPASESFDVSRDEARGLLKRDRMSALDERMGDEDAFVKAATDFALSAARDGSGFQGYTKDAPDYGTQSLGGMQNIYDFYDRNVTGGVPNEHAAMALIDPDGTMYFENQLNPAGRVGEDFDGDLVSNIPGSVSLMDWVRDNPKDSISGLDLPKRVVDPDLNALVESEARRDLQKARNYNSGLDYGMKEDTQDAVSKAVKDRNELSKEARFAFTLNKFLTDKGISPRTMAGNSYLRGGQSIFGR